MDYRRLTNLLKRRISPSERERNEKVCTCVDMYRLYYSKYYGQLYAFTHIVDNNDMYRKRIWRASKTLYHGKDQKP